MEDGKSDRADRLASELAELTGESMTAAITVVLEERLARIAREAHALPRFDERSADEILGYDDAGLPT